MATETAIDVVMPQMGVSVSEGTITRWLKQEGEQIEADEPLLEISTGVKKLLNDALARAEESPQPDPATLLDGVYATPEDLDTPHHK